MAQPRETSRNGQTNPPRPVASPDVSVIIVSYNVRPFLEQALESLATAEGDLDVETFVVDNNSSDGSPEMVKHRFPEVHLIANDENKGFAEANNQAIQKASGRYVLILNPDTVVQEDTLTTLTKFLDEHPEAGGVGCFIMNPDGSFAPESRRSFPHPTTAFYRLSGLNRLFPGHPRFDRYNLAHKPVDEPCTVEALSGSCMLIRSEAIATRPEGAAPNEIPTSTDRQVAQGTQAADAREADRSAGLMDEQFYLYGEDLDWCHRIRQAGWKLYYTPETRVLHYKGRSTDPYSAEQVYWFYRAMYLFVDKHMSSEWSALSDSLIKTAILTHGLFRLANTGLRRILHRIRQDVVPSSARNALFVGSDATAGQLKPVFREKPPIPFAIVGSYHLPPESQNSTLQDDIEDLTERIEATASRLNASAVVVDSSRITNSSLFELTRRLHAEGLSVLRITANRTWLIGPERAYSLEESQHAADVSSPQAILPNTTTAPTS